MRAVLILEDVTEIYVQILRWSSQFHPPPGPAVDRGSSVRRWRIGFDKSCEFASFHGPASAVATPASAAPLTRPKSQNLRLPTAGSLTLDRRSVVARRRSSLKPTGAVA